MVERLRKCLLNDMMLQNELQGTLNLTRSFLEVALVMLFIVFPHFTCPSFVAGFCNEVHSHNKSLRVPM